ncbi:hypothetical protein, partial [Mesorhizobium sp. M4B.F.Ca.ET.089.01.1.1]|uniref:hypothetical protein n=1 Tax=Mesorhizobium sp. M4B.F.Ca.ET.089.01.1.1 TaxID=2496662 RepID=UPI001AEC994F
VLKRSSAEYERLAGEILADPGWIAAQQLPWRKRQRVRAHLIDAALSKTDDITQSQARRRHGRGGGSDFVRLGVGSGKGRNDGP